MLACLHLLPDSQNWWRGGGSGRRVQLETAPVRRPLQVPSGLQPGKGSEAGRRLGLMNRIYGNRFRPSTPGMFERDSGVSNSALTWAFKQSSLPASARFVLVAFANCANDKQRGDTYPSVRQLHEMTGLNRKTILAAVQMLVTRGFLSDTGRRKGRTKQVKVFHITVPKAGSLNGAANGTLSGQTVPNFPPKSPKFTRKESQKRDTETLGTPIEPSEDLPTRLKSMIASFEKVGNKAKADRYRKELEDLGAT